MTGDFDAAKIPLEGTLLLEASAGTGKTWNLVRIVDRLLRDYAIPPEKLLLVTFTNDAVNELRSRQREISPDTGKMTITTIHGFCGSLLQQFPFESGVPFRLEPVSDDGGLLKDLLRDFIRRGGMDSDPDIALTWGRLLLKKGDISAVEYLYSGLRPFAEDPALKVSGSGEEDSGMVKLFRKLSETIIPGLREEKKRLGIVDFSGMIDLVHSLVTGDGAESEAFRQAVRSRYSAALIDEFQDTDARQWDIFRNLFGHPPSRLILIGDPKQSIYGFRGSDLTQYLKARETVDPDKRYLLRFNFRSVKPVIDVFGELFTPFFDEYPPQLKGDKPVPGLCDPSGKPAPPLTFIPLDSPSIRIGDIRKTWFVNIADLICKLVSGGWRLGSRRVRASDFMILVDRNRHGDILRDLLRERGILAVTFSGTEVTREREAEHFNRLLAALAEPDRRGPVCGALMSLFFCLSPEQVYMLEQSGGMDRMHTLFAQWRDLVDQGNLQEVLTRVYQEGAVLSEMIGTPRLPLPEQLLGEPGGERTLTNIRHLAELYQEELRKGGLDCRRLHQRLLSGNLKFSDAETREIRLDREGNCVQIMTVHKSKGLEAPLVIYAGGFSSVGRSKFPDIWLDETAGCRCFSPEPDDNDKDRKKLSDFNEMKRLFYVALTRAASALWLPLPAAEVLSCSHSSYDSLFGVWVTERLREIWPDKKDRIRFPVNLKSGINGAFNKNKKNPFLREDFYRVLSEELDAFADRLAAKGLASVDSIPPAAVPGQKAPGSVPEDAVNPPPSSPEGKLPVHPERRIKPVTSFSTLMKSAENANPAGLRLPDDRDRAPEIPAEKRAALKADDPLAGLAGPVFGDMMHDLLEELAFDLPAGRTEEEFRELETVRNTLLLALRRYYPAGKEKQFYVSVAGLLYRTLTTPVPQLSGRPLCSLQQENVIREMEFLYPDPDRPDGFIKGYIDLVFEAEGKIWLADWKTNLPESEDPRAPFDREMMEKVMKTHNYHLQAELYREALLRFMKKSGVDTALFGGTIYFFLRGMDRDGRGMYFIENARGY